MKQRESGLPFDDIRALVSNLPEVNMDMDAHVTGQAKDAPGLGSGTMQDYCRWFARWSGRSPVIANPVLTLFAGTHKADDSGLAWLLDRVAAIASGNSGINRLCQADNMGLKLLDLALQVPVEDITKEAAFDEKSCAGTIAFGMEAIAGGTDLLCISSIERSASASALAITSRLLAIKPAEIAMSLGADPADQAVSIAQAALDRVGARVLDPLEVLRELGGRETAAICGAILAARSQHIPVILAGPSAVASAVILETLEEHSAAHCCVAGLPKDSALRDVFNKAGIAVISEPSGAADPSTDAILTAHTIRSASLLLAEGQSR